MGQFDFTYELPDNFDKRLNQYLRQMNHIDIANSIKRCEYEYDDQGYAYYAGMSGDNWNKHAIDITIEGAEDDIKYLENNCKNLKEAFNKALKSNESGLLARKFYFLVDNDYFENIPETNEERLNVDLETAQIVLDDLLQIGERLCLNSLYNDTSSENSINDFFRDMLCCKGYDEIKDQTRHGISANGKEAGEVDLLITKNGKEIAIFEGLKLNSVNQSYINTHIEKGIINYNALGTATYIVAYVNTANFESFWNRYSSYIKEYKIPLKIKKEYKELAYPNAATRVATEILTRDGYDFPVYFIAFKVS